MRKALLLLGMIAVGGCVPRVAPPPALPPAPAPAPAPVPRPGPVLSGDWRDWPLTPGDWSYRPAAGGSVATFGVAGSVPSVTLTCNRTARQLRLVRAGTAATAAPMTIVTTSLTRTIPSSADGRGGMAALFAANDPLLDAMGYSRGRFIIEQAGLPTLVVPAWPEIERVTEDCRG